MEIARSLWNLDLGFQDPGRISGTFSLLWWGNAPTWAIHQRIKAQKLQYIVCDVCPYKFPLGSGFENKSGWNTGTNMISSNFWAQRSLNTVPDYPFLIWVWWKQWSLLPLMASGSSMTRRQPSDAKPIIEIDAASNIAISAATGRREWRICGPLGFKRRRMVAGGGPELWSADEGAPSSAFIRTGAGDRPWFEQKSGMSNALIQLTKARVWKRLANLLSWMHVVKLGDTKHSSLYSSSYPTFFCYCDICIFAFSLETFPFIEWLSCTMAHFYGKI